MEKKITKSGPLREPADKHSTYPPQHGVLHHDGPDVKRLP